ncbi:MAG: hypothetical protein IAE79_24000 [Anaerolinea sp.]|nr:hypothetical protein [Anaerolinea sp.]
MMRWPTWLWWMICVGGVTAVLYWRRPDAFYNPQFWAEDGNIFFTNAYFLGDKSLITPYAGYFHTLARIVAWVGSYLPVQYAPHWYTAAAWGMFIFIITYLFSARFPFQNNLKFLLGLALVVTTADNEVYFNLANWATITSIIWLLLAISNEPDSHRQAIFDAALLLLTGLNSPFSISLWLLFLLRWIIRRTDHSLKLWLASLLVALIQIWHMFARAATETGVLAFPVLRDGILYRFGFLFLGETIYGVPLTNISRSLILAAMIGLYGYLLWHAMKQKNWPVLTILAGGILSATLSLYVMRYNPSGLMYSAGRHFYIPAVTLVWALLLVTDTRKWLPLFATFIAFLFLTPGSKNQVLPDMNWAEETAKCIGTQPLCLISTNPVLEPPVWWAAIDSHVFEAPAMDVVFVSQFGEHIELLGYNAVQDDTAVHLQFVWRSSGKMQDDYKFLIQLVDDDDPNRIVIQNDLAPLDGQYPTSSWLEQEVVIDPVILPLETIPAGQYQIMVGWYNPQIGVQLTAYDAQQRRWKSDWVALPLAVEVDGNGRHP